MKKNIFDEPALVEVLLRVGKLKEQTPGRWGKLNSNQMVCHLSMAAKMALGEVQVPDQSNLITRTLVRWLFLNNIKPPGRKKGKIQTFEQVDVIKQNMQVDTLAMELSNYQAILHRILRTETLCNKHPLFGKMSRKDWGLLCYAHADYHLTQFDV